MPDISKHIVDFLSISDTIIIAGFGKISKEYVPARLDRTANKISPPHYMLHFSDTIQEDPNDSLLLYISKTEHISFVEAAEALQDYKKILLLKIFEYGEINVPGLGTFYAEVDAVKFKSETIDLEAATIDAYPINRKINKVEKSNKSKNNKNKVLIYRILIAFLILVSLVFSMFFLSNQKKAAQESDKGENNTVAIKKDITEKTDSIQKFEAELETESEKPKAEIKIDSFLIAVGTYGGFENAAKIEKLLKRDGYKVLTKQYKSGKVRVSVLIEGQVSDLDNALKNIRLKYDKAAFVVE